MRRDRKRGEVEERDAGRIGELGEDVLEPGARITGPRRDTEARLGDHALGVLPAQKVAELVGADQEQGIVPVARAQGVDGPLVLVDLDLIVGECGSRQASAGLGVELDVLVTRFRSDEDRERVERESLLRSLCERNVSVVRRVERAAEQADHSTTSSSPPTSTVSPLRAPAAFNAASSSASSAGASPAMRKPRSVRRTRKRRPDGRGR